MRYDRTIALIGDQQLAKMNSCRIMILGLGGVGGHAAEALARLGVGKMVLVDPDIVQETDINRQIIALDSTIGRAKTEVMTERIKDINPMIEVVSLKELVTIQNAERLIDLDLDVVVDCIDDVPAKTAIILACQKRQIAIMSSMGFANKMHPDLIRIGTLRTTSVCPLARAVRTNVRKLGGNLDLSVVYSVEPPITKTDGNAKLGSVSFVPAVAGMMLAFLVANHIMVGENQK